MKSLDPEGLFRVSAKITTTYVKEQCVLLLILICCTVVAHVAMLAQPCGLNFHWLSKLSNIITKLGLLWKGKIFVDWAH